MTVFAHSQTTNKLVNEATNDSARVSGQDRKIPPTLGTNQIAEFGEFRPLASLEKNNLLFSSQYGFCKGHSTQHAILDIVNAIQTNMNQGLFSCGVFIDLKKAFDTVDHNILLYKLNHYDFHGIFKDWFTSYLNNRMQSTQIGPYISNKANVSCDIPQGSVIGPLLFYCMLMTYINVRINLSFIFSEMILISCILIKT